MRGVYKEVRYQEYIKMKKNSYTELMSGLIEKSNLELIIPFMEKVNEESEFRQFVFTILFKLTNGLETISLLFHNFETKPQFADTIFISQRALLADMITVYYLLLKSDFEEENLQEELDKIKFDHVNFSIENLKLYKELYNSSDKEIATRKEEIIKAFPKYFDNEGNTKKGFKRLKSIGGMVKEIKSNSPVSKFQGNTILAFEHYDLYSKYEHLGHYTSKLVFRSYNRTEIEHLKTEIKTSLNLLLNFKYALLTEFYTQEQIEKTTYYMIYNQLKEFESGM
jgi:hypothetical protein